MFYKILRLILGIPVFYLLFWPKIIGKKNLKIKGMAVIISNHTSNWDPVFIGVAFSRIVYWMGKSELFKGRLARVVLNALKSFPVKRGEGDMAAIRNAFRILREGNLLGIFPEGTRIKTGELSRFEPGTSLIALKNNAPVVPIYIHGSYKPFRRMKLVVGEPLYLTDYPVKKTDTASVEAATRYLEEKISELKNSVMAGK